MLLTCTRCLYIQTVTHCYAQSLHALKLLRCHGMSNDSLTHVYNAVVISMLLYASPTWWGFTIAIDKQRLEATAYDVLSGSTILCCPNSLLTWTTIFLRTYSTIIVMFCTNYFQTTLNILITILDLGVTLCH